MDRELDRAVPPAATAIVSPVPTAWRLLAVFTSCARIYKAGTMVPTVSPRGPGPEPAKDAPVSGRTSRRRAAVRDDTCASLQRRRRQRAEQEGSFRPEHMGGKSGSPGGGSLPVTATACRAVGTEPLGEWGRGTRRKWPHIRSVMPGLHRPRKGWMCTLLLIPHQTPRGQACIEPSLHRLVMQKGHCKAPAGAGPPLLA